ncbi:MAG: hypothetical protein AAGU15_09075 [Anaerolineaceae bacterium]
MNLDQEVFSSPGNPQETMRRLYGKELSFSNAKKYLAGIRLHINTKRLSTDSQYTQQETVYNKDKSQTIKRDIYLNDDEAASPISVMKKCGFDPLLWEVVTCRLVSGSWDVTLKNAHGEGVLHTNRKYSVTLTVKPLAGKLTSDQILDVFKSLPPIKVTQYKYNAGSFMLELPIMDFHLGKLSWGDETGQDDYDLKIAEKLWKETVTDILSKVSVLGNPEYVLFPIGQDFFHFDTPTVTTTSGTQLDSDTRWQKMFAKGIELLVWAIEQCRALAPVKVMWVPGNHDTMLSYAATVGIAQRYAFTESVEVDLTPTPRKYHQYGLNLIGFAHGVDEGKRIKGLMQIEAPSEWGSSVWREFHLGHLHSESTLSENGIVFRRISSVTAADSWHTEKGFIGATRQAQAFVWDRDRGLQAILNSNVRSE